MATAGWFNLSMQTRTTRAAVVAAYQASVPGMTAQEAGIFVDACKRSEAFVVTRGPMKQFYEYRTADATVPA